MERHTRRRDRGILAARDGEFTYEPVHRGQNFGRARFDSGRWYGERQEQSGEYPHETTRPDRRQLHGLRRFRGADFRSGLHEDEEATRDD